MKFELKEFQQGRCGELLDELAAAREEYERRSKNQAIVFSSPTGSGKTITIAAVLERLFRGAEGHPARPYSRVLWISDSPELNTQSRDKLLRACDHFGFDNLIEVDSAFDQEFLPEGKVCFINTQLLGKDKKLTQNGDNRTYTFWQTVANTVRDFPADTLLVIDEAHRGMGVSTTERNKRKTIIQKFIGGSSADGLPPVPVILGMSATTQRFDEFLAGAGSDRTTRKVHISPSEVQDSGLLKDTLVVVNPEGAVNGDMTLLEGAAQKWKEFESLWQQYCEAEDEELVRPVLVVQVADGVDHEDASRRILTKTNLNEVVSVLSRTIGPFGKGALVHCFDKASEVVAGGETIRKIDASRIQDDEVAKVVFFKTALSTGWDCPRAEIMMSFRRAVDHTLIAQLVGRMIRTPLARRIERDEMLNTVNLYLPHYDSNSLDNIISELRNPDAEDRPPTSVERKLVSYERNPELADVFPAIESLPTYSISKLRPLSPVKRLLRYASLLTLKDKIDLSAYDKSKDALIDLLLKHRDKKVQQDEKWARVVKEGGEIDLSVSSIDLADLGLPRHVEKVRTRLTPENVHRLFESCGRLLAAGEGLEIGFWKKAHDENDPDRAKLELHALVREPDVIKELETMANDLFKQLEKESRSKIKALHERSKMRYRAITDRTGKPEHHDWELPHHIVERGDGETWEKHLFCDAQRVFHTDLNTWEETVLKAEVERSDFVGWLRNRERANWALEIPYEFGGDHSFYPDFIIVRNVNGSLVFDIIEPHRPSFDDTHAKAKGLAQYARDHGEQFDRMMMCLVEDVNGTPRIQSFDVNDPDTREKALSLRSNNDVQFLYSKALE